MLGFGTLPWVRRHRLRPAHPIQRGDGFREPEAGCGAAGESRRRSAINPPGSRRLAIAAAVALVAVLSVVLVLVLRDHAAGPQPDGGKHVHASPSGTLTPTPAQDSASGRVTVCATHLCVNGSPWYMNGASVYNPGLRPEQSGFLNPTGTVALAERAGLDTIRIVNFFSDDGIPESTPYAETTWEQVDQMIDDAGAARDYGGGRRMRQQRDRVHGA